MDFVCVRRPGRDALAWRPASARRSRHSSRPTRQHVEALASERLDGRLTGSHGERLAGDYLVSQLQRIGAKPLPGATDYRLPFEFTAGTRDGGSTRRRREQRRPERLAAVVHRIESPARRRPGAVVLRQRRGRAVRVVFAGYGIVVPDSQDFGYDSYAGLDVKDKIVLVLRYFPEDADQKTKGDPRALLGPALQGDGGAPARREGDRWSSPVRDRRTRASWFR